MKNESAAQNSTDEGVTPSIGKCFGRQALFPQQTFALLFQGFLFGPIVSAENRGRKQQTQHRERTSEAGILGMLSSARKSLNCRTWDQGGWY